MSSRMFQSVIMQMKDASDRLVGVIDGEGLPVWVISGKTLSTA